MSEPARGIGLLLKSKSASPITITELPTRNSRRVEDAWNLTPPPTPEVPAWEERMEAVEGWPATVRHRLPQERRAAVHLIPPLLRHLRSVEGLRLHQGNEPDELLIRATEARAGDRVLLGIEDGQLVVDGYLSEDAYSRQIARCIRRLLADEASPHIRIDAIRTSRRRLEAWLGLPEDPRNPWALPGDLSDGTLYLSRHILDWCSERVKVPLDQWLEGALPSTDEWGPGPLTFATVRGIGGSFTSILISENEHTAQSDAWHWLMKSQHEQFLPEGIRSLLNQLSIPVPAMPLPDHLSVLVSWSTAEAPGLARRAQAMLLLSLSNTAQRNSLRGLGLVDRQVEILHRQWTAIGCPTDILPGLVTDEELPAALTAQIGGPGMMMIERLEAQIERRLLSTSTMARLKEESDKMNAQVEALKQEAGGLQKRRDQAEAILAELERQVVAYAPAVPAIALPTRAATLSSFREEFDARVPGLPGACADRLLLAITAAQDLGAPILLIGSESAEIASALPDIIAGSSQHHIPVRPEWSAECDLLGNIDGDRFIATEFTEAIQQTTSHAVRSEQNAPGFIWLEGMDRADTSRYTPSLLSALERDHRLTLYPHSQHVAWMEAGSVTNPNGWQLALPPNLVLLGTLEGHSALAEPLIDRSLMLRLPIPNLASALSFAGSCGTSRLVLPEQPAGPVANSAWDNLLTALHILSPLGLQPSRRLGRQATALLGRAASWGIIDSDTVSAHLVHLLLLGRITNVHTVEPLQKLLDCSWLTEELAGAIEALIEEGTS